MTMHWNTYLVRLYTDVNRMDAWEERMRRTQLITEGFIRPQAQEIALARDDARNALESLDLNYERDTPTHPNSIIARIEPRIRKQPAHQSRRYCRVPRIRYAGVQRDGIPTTWHDLSHASNPGR